MTKEIIEEMKSYTEINRKETFYIIHKNGKEAFVTLETLNYFINELKEAEIKVVANCYCNWSKHCNKAIVSQW
jgi:hypothetical protein